VPGPVGPAVWILVARLLPVLRELVRATRKTSDGGRRITPAERDQILAVALGSIRSELEGGLADLDGRDLADLDADERGGEGDATVAPPPAPRRPRRPSRRRRNQGADE
jgi:hypothetical protein